MGEYVREGVCSSPGKEHAAAMHKSELEYEQRVQEVRKDLEVSAGRWVRHVSAVLVVSGQVALSAHFYAL